MTQYRRQLFGAIASLIILAGGALMSCDRDTDTPTTPDHSTFQSGQLNNFIIGSADVSAWGGEYVKNNAYFMVNIPVSGAVKVDYTVTGGGTYAIFVDTTTPTKWEIGLKTVDGVTDTLERVCVTYTEGTAFAAAPANSETATQHKATHYLRKLENGGTENWWPTDAAFAFAGETKTVCVVTDGQVQGVDVAGQFPKITRQCPNCGLLIPGYIYPDFPNGYWKQLAEAADTLGEKLVVIANPDSGPGTSQNSDYVNAINAVRNNGGRVIGYVPTTYGMRAFAAIQADVDAWYNWYEIDGIFFDEASTKQADAPFYQTLYDDVQTMSAGSMVVFNFGIVPHSDYFEISDAIFCVFENHVAAFSGWMPPVGIPAERSLVLVHNLPASGIQPALQHFKQTRMQWFYFTSDTMPNPWDMLPSYFSELVQFISN